MLEFHKAFGVPFKEQASLIPNHDFIRRLTLITSEVGELGDAIRTRDLLKIADAIGDLLYVTFGMATEMGIDIDAIFTEIHRSNMTKIGPDGSIHKDVGGKILKPATYSPANLKPLLT